MPNPGGSTDEPGAGSAQDEGVDDMPARAIVGLVLLAHVPGAQAPPAQPAMKASIQRLGGARRPLASPPRRSSDLVASCAAPRPAVIPPVRAGIAFSGGVTPRSGPTPARP